MNIRKTIAYSFLAALIVLSLSFDTFAGPRGGGGGGGRSSGGSSRSSSSSSRPASRPSTPSRSPSRPSSPSTPSKPSSAPKPAPSAPSASQTASSRNTSSGPSAQPSSPSAAPAAMNVTPSTAGRNAGLNGSPIKTPTATAISGDTRDRPTSSNATSSGRNASIAKSTSSPPAMSSAEKALYERAKQSGTVFASREEAAVSFKQKYASEFKSTFDREPPVRPTYIPSTYTYSTGHTTTVIYEPRYRGYGYWSGGGPNLGDFILYDMLADAAMSQRVYVQKGYYVGPPPTYVSYWGDVFLVFLVLFICIILVVVFFSILRKS